MLNVYVLVLPAAGTLKPLLSYVAIVHVMHVFVCTQIKKTEAR